MVSRRNKPMDRVLRLSSSVERTRLSDAVYETLLEAILAGQLPPGTIVSEVALAKKFTVSRTPVHDALRQLAKDGLVEQRANHRAVIARFTPEDVHDIFEMRMLLEGEAARRAALHIDRQTLCHLRQVAEGLGQSRNDPDWVGRWADFDEAFHLAIAKASGSSRLYQDILRYRLLHRGFNKLATNVGCLQQALAEHLQILEALEKGDAEIAKQSMVAHIQEWQDYFVNHFPRS